MAKRKPYSVCICIITYNRLAYTKECIASFIAHAPRNWSMCILDNGSTDGTREWLKKEFARKKNVKVILSDVNLYPGGGNQRLLQEAFTSDTYLLCDNDGLFTGKDWYKVGRSILNSGNVGLVNMRASRWREDEKFSSKTYELAGVELFRTKCVASFSLINEGVRQALIKHLSGQWIGWVIGKITVAAGFDSVALKHGLIFDQSENDLNNPEYRAQYEKFWKEKKRLNKFREMVATLDEEQGVGYRNPNRTTGSQQEVPTWQRKGDTVHVGGYQLYKVRGGQVIPLSKVDKYHWVMDQLKPLNDPFKPFSFADIGCSNGILCLMAATEMGSHATGLDHDMDCIKLINSVAAQTRLPVEAKYYRFGDDTDRHDVVCALALVHWLFGCTAKYTTFADIFGYLACIAGKYLVIEWVAPHDKAVRKFGHLNYGDAKDYTLENFEAAARGIGAIKATYDWCDTRRIYLIERTQ